MLFQRAAGGFASLRRLLSTMSWDEEERPLRAAELEALASERLAELRAVGEELCPVVERSRALARHFWGKAWMRQLAHCESGGFALAPGRTLLRHQCVLDVQLSPGLVRARVSTQRLEEVELRLAPLDEERQEELLRHCQGRIDSLVSLMEGKVDAAVLECLCDPQQGLLPEPADWKMSCSCADWAEPCPHAAAAIYAAGVLIDADPSLLFTLRAFDPAALLAPVEQAAPADFAAEDLGKLFGIELDV